MEDEAKVTDESQRSDKETDEWRESFVAVRNVIGRAIYRDLFR